MRDRAADWSSQARHDLAQAGASRAEVLGGEKEGRQHHLGGSRLHQLLEDGVGVVDEVPVLTLQPHVLHLLPAEADAAPPPGIRWSRTPVFRWANTGRSSGPTVRNAASSTPASLAYAATSHSAEVRRAVALAACHRPVVSCSTDMVPPAHNGRGRT
jgi:hypothetical protein